MMKITKVGDKWRWRQRHRYRQHNYTKWSDSHQIICTALNWIEIELCKNRINRNNTSYGESGKLNEFEVYILRYILSIVDFDILFWIEYIYTVFVVNVFVSKILFVYKERRIEFKPRRISKWKWEKNKYRKR